MTKRIAISVIAALLLCLSLACSARATDMTFVDVSRDSPWYDAVAYAVDEGVAQGVGESLFPGSEHQRQAVGCSGLPGIPYIMIS